LKNTKVQSEVKVPHYFSEERKYNKFHHTALNF